VTGLQASPCKLDMQLDSGIHLQVYKQACHVTSAGGGCRSKAALALWQFL
jgi:hypothetical protein